MRQGISNKRLRSRNRKSPSPLARVYESNGPDVKIRGSAQQVADKYAQLSRDAQSAGDRVMAENYLQHAEHYYRILAAAQPQGSFRDEREERDEDRDDLPGRDGRDEQPREIRDDDNRDVRANGGNHAHAGEAVNGADVGNGFGPANGHPHPANGHGTDDEEEDGEDRDDGFQPGYDASEEDGAEDGGEGGRRRSRRSRSGSRTRSSRRRAGGADPVAGEGETPKTDP